MDIIRWLLNSLLNRRVTIELLILEFSTQHEQGVFQMSYFQLGIMETFIRVKGLEVFMDLADATHLWHYNLRYFA